jgi:hypothetical protein
MSIESIKREYEQQLMQLPNVTGVGIGEKRGKPVIKVFVTHKVSESALQSHEIIPKNLGQYETCVEELGMVTAQPASPQYPNP